MLTISRPYKGKSALFDIFENKVKYIGEQPENVGANILDGQFLLHTSPPNLPPTYEGIARSILTQSFDDNPQPSIKDTERARRGTDAQIFIITGPEQRRVPRTLLAELFSCKPAERS